jgi:hypothetical protein
MKVDLPAIVADVADLVDHLGAAGADFVTDLGRDRCLGSGGFLARLGDDSASVTERGWPTGIPFLCDPRGAPCLMVLDGPR